MDIEPGETVDVSFGVSMSQLAFLDAELRWRVEAGEVDILIGASSADLRLADVVTVTSDALVDGASRALFASASVIRGVRVPAPARHSREGAASPIA